MDQSISERFTFDEVASEEARICVVGVGGGGGNAVNNMIKRGINGVDFIAINTDSQALMANRAPVCIQAGRSLTKGLGAGARPSVGANAVDESRSDIEEALQGYDMVFITAGMGGGTGTGGAPVVAEMARNLGILTVGVVTKPFLCEGPKRMRSAKEGIEFLREHVDTFIAIPNERLLDIAEEDTTLIEAFARADDVLYNATRGISDLITVHGFINLDFADVKTTMEDGGTALMGSASASGDNRAEKAAIEAISSPLLDGLSIAGATNVLVNITSGPSLGIREATKATSIIQREAGDDVEVIFGTVIDDSMEDDIRVTVIATGFDRGGEKAAQEKPRRTVGMPDDTLSYVQYKGEENLRHLDTPAYERRSPLTNVEPKPSSRRSEPNRQDSESSGARMQRLSSSELKDRDGRGRTDDPDTPAFLRKLMD